VTLRTTDLLPIGEIAARSGVAPSALRYYESVGLIESVRSSGGQRRFPRSVLRRVAYIRVAQQVGLTLDEIAASLRTLPDSRTPTVADWQRLSKGWQERIDARIRELEVLRSQLTSCIGCGCLSLRDCALRNRDDVARAYGTGPQWLNAAVAGAAR
jgi:MerR family transcriptional regulator, redox-sensitive transcriptional activator SoxR